MCQVSVIIPTRNRRELLHRAVSSVLAQTHGDLECIVVDDASTDGTADLVGEFDDERLVYLRQETHGHASAARNKGMGQARGQMIAFLDDDDEWHPSKLAKQVALLSSLPPRVGMVYCWMDYVAGGRVIKSCRPELKGFIFKEALHRQPIGNSSTLLVRRSVINRIGGFDEFLPRGNDGDFIRRVCRDYEVDYVPEVMVKVHMGHGHEQITSHDDAGIRNHIKGQMVKLRKFRADFADYPREAAGIYSDVAFRHIQIGEIGKGINCFIKAFRTFPLSPAIFGDVKRAIRHLRTSGER